MDAERDLYPDVESSGNVADMRHPHTESSKGEFSSIEKLARSLPRPGVPVGLQGVTLLAIGKISDERINAKAKGQGKGQGEKGHTGKKGKKGKGVNDAGTQKTQPVYLGDDKGRVICTLATGDDVKRVPATFPRYAYVDITALVAQPGSPGILYWTKRTEMSLRSRPGNSKSNYIFPYDVTSDYSKDFASMNFVRECSVGTYVALPMRITDVVSKWTSTQNEPYLELFGFDIEKGKVGPLRLWNYEEGDINPGSAYFVRGLRVVNDRAYDQATGTWYRSPDMPKIVDCNPRVACEDVDLSLIHISEPTRPY